MPLPPMPALFDIHPRRNILRKLHHLFSYDFLHAYFEEINLCGYERYCGWIQIIERRDYMDMNDGNPITLFELDIPGKMREHKIPYFAYGYPAECNKLFIIFSS